MKVKNFSSPFNSRCCATCWSGSVTCAKNFKSWPEEHQWARVLSRAYRSRIKEAKINENRNPIQLWCLSNWLLKIYVKWLWKKDEKCHTKRSKSILNDHYKISLHLCWILCGTFSTKRRRSHKHRYIIWTHAKNFESNGNCTNECTTHLMLFSVFVHSFFVVWCFGAYFHSIVRFLTTSSFN